MTSLKAIWFHVSGPLFLSLFIVAALQSSMLAIVTAAVLAVLLGTGYVAVSRLDALDNFEPADTRLVGVLALVSGAGAAGGLVVPVAAQAVVVGLCGVGLARSAYDTVQAIR